MTTTKKKYLIRLDDACPTMDKAKWMRMEEILDRYGVKPMVGVIPHNEDPQQEIDAPDAAFWTKVQGWQEKGWAVALHGYTHVYQSFVGGGINPMWKRSEFCGVPLDEQKDKIRKGVAILRENGINPKYFFAPSHTFDENTLVALREESDIRIISDTIATRPYRYEDFVFIPQFSGQCRDMKMRGLYTFCSHPNTMTDAAFKNAERFLAAHRDSFVAFGSVDLTEAKGKSLFDRVLTGLYFTYRKIRDIK